MNSFRNIRKVRQTTPRKPTATRLPQMHGATFRHMGRGKAQSGVYYAESDGYKVVVITDQWGRPKTCFISKGR